MTARLRQSAGTWRMPIPPQCLNQILSHMMKNVPIAVGAQNTHIKEADNNLKITKICFVARPAQGKALAKNADTEVEDIAKCRDGRKSAHDPQKNFRGVCQALIYKIVRP